MKELRAVKCEESNSVLEKSRGRQFKSREQLQGLEDFYTDYKYPSESLKAEIALTLNLTEKQVTVWFCHRRLKDKRLLIEESQTPGRQDFSSGVIQDHGSRLKQDSCSSTKQADCERVDPREVESLRFRHENLRSVELNYPQRGDGGGNEYDTSPSESNSTSQETFYPHNRRKLAARPMEYRVSNRFVQPNRGRVGPSGYLKIKGHVESVAITAVKRQLGRYYREDGPSLGIEFDLLPPKPLESSSKNIYDAHRVPSPVIVRHDMSGDKIHPGRTMRNEKRFESLYMQSPPPGESCYQLKPKLPFSFHSHGFRDQDSSFKRDTYLARETLEFNRGRIHMYDTFGWPSDPRRNNPSHSYGGEIVSDPKKPSWPGYGPVDPDRPANVRHKDHLPSNRTAKMFIPHPGDEVNAERGPASEHKDSSKSKIHPANERRVNKRGRDEVLTDNYPIRTSQNPAPIRTSQNHALRARRLKN